jgi:hypothetical protein
MRAVLKLERNRAEVSEESIPYVSKLGDINALKPNGYCTSHLL